MWLLYYSYHGGREHDENQHERSCDQRAPQPVQQRQPNGQSDGEASSGYRINRAADDAAGLAISEKIAFFDQRLQPSYKKRARRFLDSDGGRGFDRSSCDAAADEYAGGAVG